LLWRLQDNKNRQNSIELSAAESESAAYLINDWEALQLQVTEAAKEAYSWAIKNGIAKEQARSVLPEGLTVSRMYMNGTLRSWIHYCELRMANGTQKEHQLVAKSAWEEILKEFPSLNTILE
jgi:thymidylate synthase (FAD)